MPQVKTALVTGSAGFVGRHLVPKLKAAGYEVTENDVIHGAAPHFTPQTFDVVVHLAANILDVDQRVKGGIEMYKDIELDLSMCRFIERHPPRQAFIAMSSCAVDYPEDPYSWVKLTLEQFCGRLHRQGIPTVILRPFSGYGFDQALSYPFPAILRRAMRHENPLVVWGGHQVRDWLHIDDLTDAIIHGIDGFPRGKPIDIGTGLGTNFISLASMMADACNYEPVIMGDDTKATSSSRRVANIELAETCGWVAKIDLWTGINRCMVEKTLNDTFTPA